LPSLRHAITPESTFAAVVFLIFDSLVRATSVLLLNNGLFSFALFFMCDLGIVPFNLSLFFFLDRDVNVLLSHSRFPPWQTGKTPLPRVLFPHSHEGSLWRDSKIFLISETRFGLFCPSAPDSSREGIWSFFFFLEHGFGVPSEGLAKASCHCGTSSRPFSGTLISCRSPHASLP